MKTCAIDPTPEPTDPSPVECSLAVLTIAHAKGQSPKFVNASKQLLYIYADLDGDGDVDRAPLFDTSLEDFFWDYDNHGQRLAQLRFYPCPTTVPARVDPAARGSARDLEFAENVVQLTSFRSWSAEALRSPTISAHSWNVPAGTPSGASRAGRPPAGTTSVLLGLGAADVDDRHGGAEDDVGADHGPLADADALDYDRARADEGAVFDDDRRGLRRQHATDADAAGEVHVRADLGAGAHRRPRVHHRPRPDPGADVHEARHQHHARREEAAVARHPAGDDTYAALGESDFSGILSRNRIGPASTGSTLRSRK